ncbi:MULTISPECIES: hypothetical protein [unclassified Bradyrhizobium]|uniref:hypothetical protein n=1 Tax=unclassified Bradyrhizobium TaxID=2631580 RepID=UPI0028F010B6|nr:MULTISPECIES: hypothetical protein [unclassified Bradyrhizobium]
MSALLRLTRVLPEKPILHLYIDRPKKFREPSGPAEISEADWFTLLMASSCAQAQRHSKLLASPTSTISFRTRNRRLSPQLCRSERKSFSDVSNVNEDSSIIWT